MIAVGVPLLWPWFPSIPLAFLEAAIASNQNSHALLERSYKKARYLFNANNKGKQSSKETAKNKNPIPINSQFLL